MLKVVLEIPSNIIANFQNFQMNRSPSSGNGFGQIQLQNKVQEQKFLNFEKILLSWTCIPHFGSKFLIPSSGSEIFRPGREIWPVRSRRSPRRRYSRLIHQWFSIKKLSSNFGAIWSFLCQGASISSDRSRLLEEDLSELCSGTVF